MRICFLIILFFHLLPEVSAQRVTHFGNHAAFCPGGSILLSALPAPASNIQWSFSQNPAGPYDNIAGATGSTHVANMQGYYTLRSGISPIIQYDTLYISESITPVVNFTFDNANTCSNQFVNFVSSVTGGVAPYTYEWDFGDGAISGLANPTHSFPAYGCTAGTQDFEVTLDVIDAVGCRSTIRHTVSASLRPEITIVDVSGNNFSNCNNNPTPSNPLYELTIGNGSPGASCIQSYDIDWGDGTPVETDVAFPLTHTYTTLGAFTLTVTAHGAGGMCQSVQTYTVANQSNPAGGLSILGSTTNLCAPAAVPFRINDWWLNSPGTRYVIDFGDGSAPLELVHPLNNADTAMVVNRVYTTTSCPTPSYYATLEIINGCYTSTSIVGPIQIRTQPTASFSVGSGSNCVDQCVQFINTTIPGFSGSTCLQNTTYIWNFGDGNTSFQTNPCHTYSTPGTYTVTLTANNGMCGGPTTYTMDICIDPEPAPSFTLDNTAGCIPLAVTTNNTTDLTEFCSAITWNWSVNYTATNCGNGADWEFAAGSSAISEHPRFIFNNPGTYDIVLQINSSCGVYTQTETVVVRDRPIVQVASIDDYCGAATINPSATVANCGNSPLGYSWSFPGGSPATSNVANPGPIVYSVPNTYTVSLEVTNECGTTTSTENFTVHPVPDLTLPDNPVYCSGSPSGNLPFTSSLVGTTFSWTNNNTAIGLGASGAGNFIPSFTTTNNTSAPITATITVRAVNGQCDYDESFTITVNPIPPAPVVTSPVIYCHNETPTALTASVLAGHSLLWYTTAAGGVGSATAPTPNTGTIGSTTYYVSQTNDATSCESPRSAITVTIRSVPVITATANDPTACGAANGSIVINGLTPGTTYTVSYTRSPGGITTNTHTASPSGTISITGLSSGLYNDVFVILNGCSSNSLGPFSLTDPNPPVTPVANSNSPVCSGNTLELSASTTTLGPATYSWTGPNGFTSSLQNPTIPIVSMAANGQYSVVVTINGCTSDAGTVDVVINQTPQNVTATSNSPICSGNTIELRGSSSTGGVSYSWTGPNGFTSTEQNPDIPNATSTHQGTYTLTVTLGTCTAQATTTVVVNTTPVIGNSSSNNPSNCNTATGSITLSGLTSGVSYSVNYLQDGVPRNATIVANASGNVVMANLPAGSYTDVNVITPQGCTSNTVGPFDLVDPNPPATPVADSNTPVCEGGTLNLTATSATNGVSYSWTGPNGFTSALQNPSINNVSLAASGTYTVRTTLNGCVSAAATVDVIINPTPQNVTASNSGSVCEGGSVTLSASTTTVGNISYSWSGPNGFTSTEQNPLINNIQLNQGGLYTVIVTATTGGEVCSAVAASTTVAVREVPVIGAVTFTDPTACASSTGSISLSGLVANRTYTVSYTFGGVPHSVSLAANASGTIIITNLAAGTYSNITVSFDNCTSPAEGPVSLTDPDPPATPVANSNGPVCSGNTLELFASTTTPGTATYSWTGPNGFTSSSQNPTIPNVSMAANGQYSVVVTINGCTSAAGTVEVVINQTPQNVTATSNSPICSGNTIELRGGSSTGGVSYSWSGPNGFTSTEQNPDIPNATSAHQGTYTLTVTLGTCTAQATTAVVVNTTPVIGSSSSNNPSSCNTSTGSITLSGLTSGVSYTVNYLQDGVARNATIVANASGNIVIANLPAGSYTDVNVITPQGCTSNTVGPFDLVDPDPPATPVAGSNTPVCEGGTLNLTATSATAGVTYSWSGPNGFTSTLQNPSISNVSLAASGTYTVRTTLNGCVSASGTVDVEINPTPQNVTAANSGSVCEGGSVTLSASTTTVGNISYSWSGPNGFTSTEQNPILSNAIPSQSGVYTVVVTATTNGVACSAAAVSTTVEIRPEPVIGGHIFTNPTACGSSTGSITLNGLNANVVYTVSYVRDGGSTIVQTYTASAAGTITIPNLPAGIYTDIHVVLNGCISASISTVSLTDPDPPAAPVVGTVSPLCVGNTLNLTATSNVLGVTYNWTGPNGFTSTEQNPVINNVGVSHSGIYSVTVTENNCISAAATVSVIVNPLGASPIVSSPVVYCINTPSVALTATSSPNNTLVWYDVATGGMPLPSAPVPSTAVAGTVSYYVSQITENGCEGARSRIDVVVNPNAIASINPTVSIECAPFAITATHVGLQTYAANNSGYEWYADNVHIGSGATFPGYTITNPSDSVTITLIAVSAFGCLNDTVSHTFYTYGVPAPSFTLDNDEGCGPLNVTITNTTPDIHLYTYFWNFGNGITSTQAQPAGTILFPINPTHEDTTYYVRLTAMSSCDTLYYLDSVRVAAAPRALFTPDRTVACSPAEIVFTNTSLGLNNTYYWDFGDGNSFITTSRDPVSHVYHTGVVDTFNVRLRVVNDCGEDSLIYQIIVSPRTIELNYAVNGPDNFGCVPHTVAFINNSTGASTFQWNFGDGNVLTTSRNIDTVYHTYYTEGVFNVSLRATNSCTDTTATRIITVYPPPVVAFESDRYSVCIGQPIQLSNLSELATSYTWDFGDGTTSTNVNPSHTYTAPGLYTIRLVGYRGNASGDICTDTALHQIYVTDTLPGSFTIDNPIGACIPHTVRFVNQTNPAVTATWNFGDGNTAIGNEVSHTYSLPGTYTVMLTVVAPGGCIYYSEQVVTVSGPYGNLDYTSGYVCENTPVTFTANATGATEYIWNFGDGNTLTTSNNVVQHTYVNPGNYVPSVTLVNATGCSYFINGTDTIRVERIDGAFSHTATETCGISEVLFSSNSYAFYGIDEIRWDFGDGTTGIGNTVSHIYTSSGIYAVEMTVRGLSGCTEIISQFVDVHVPNSPVTSIVAPAQVCLMERIEISSNTVSIDTLSIQRWEISNGVTTTGSSFMYQFDQTGTYTIRFIVGTSYGCFDTAEHTITVLPSPTIQVANSEVTVCFGSSVQLFASASSNNYLWIPSVGLSCTDCPDPVVSPTASTQYVVSTINEFGCRAYDTVLVRVIPPLEMNVSSDINICIGESANLLASGAASYVWTPAESLNSAIISNPVASPTATTTYRVIGYDGHNCFSDTAYVTVGVGEYPVVELGPDLILATGTQQQLNTNITNGPIAAWHWSPPTDLSCSTCPLPVATARRDITYTLTATNIYGCSGSDTIRISTFCEDAQVFIPNAFTPDGDGVNDILMLRASGIAMVKYFRIFNRWGELVFERSNFPPNSPAYGWDGRVRGVVGPPEVYVYTAEVICDNGTSYIYKGNTTILK